MADIKINGKSYSLDDLTLDEAEQLEDAFDASLEEIDFRRTKVIKQVVFLLLRRDNPELTLAEVGQIKVAALAPTPNGNGRTRAK